MQAGITTVLYPVTDIARAKALFSAFLGTDPTSDAPYYVGFHIGDQEIGLVPGGREQGMTGPVGYVDVDDITKALEALVDAGATPHEKVRNVGGGKLVASVVDTDGNILGLTQSP
jgi:predicted enzyme related to lactoylglutathione lyase